VGKKDKGLSPICRRSFFKKTGGVVVGALTGAALLGSASCASYSDYSDYSNYGDGSCGYCNGDNRNYYHCDGSYCNYANYTDG
jgi:hypothetical protein